MDSASMAICHQRLESPLFARKRSHSAVKFAHELQTSVCAFEEGRTAHIALERYLYGTIKGASLNCQLINVQTKRKGVLNPEGWSTPILEVVRWHRWVPSAISKRSVCNDLGLRLVHSVQSSHV